MLEEFEFDVQHRPGHQHRNADALSRRPCRQCGLCDADAALLVAGTAEQLQAQSTGNRANQTATDPPSQPISQSESHLHIAKLQLDDEDIRPILQALRETSTRPDWENMLPCSQATKVYWTKWHDLEIHEGVLYVKESASSGALNLRLVAPKVLQAELIREAHAGFTGGHLGRRQTTEQVRRRAYWVGWSADVRRSVQSCVECCLLYTSDAADE